LGGDRGEVTATVIVVPVVLLAVLLVVQYGLAYYAHQVAAGAAHDGAAAAARQHSDPGEGAAVAQQLVSEGGGSLFASYHATASTDGDTVTVTVSGHAVTLLPFFPTITVKASGSAAVERFQAQGASP
jgi:Flp pilus assembly protein TadG